MGLKTRAGRRFTLAFVVVDAAKEVSGGGDNHRISISICCCHVVMVVVVVVEGCLAIVLFFRDTGMIPVFAFRVGVTVLTEHGYTLSEDVRWHEIS